jgi:hypothetical protein
MSIEWVERQLNEMGDPNLARAAAVLRAKLKMRHGIDDIPLPETSRVTEVFPDREELAPSFVNALSRYKDSWNNDTLNPQMIDDTWDAVWFMMCEEAKQDLDLHIPPCDRSPKELSDLRSHNRGIVLVPDEIMSEGGFAILANLLPELVKPLSKSGIRNYSDKGGCVDVEMDIEPPYRNERSRDMLTTFSNQGREGQRIQTYVAASYFSRLLTGRHFDQGTGIESILLGTYMPAPGRSDRKSPLEATRRTKDGNLDFFPGTLTKRYPFVGFRSEGRKRR